MNKEEYGFSINFLVLLVRNDDVQMCRIRTNCDNGTRRQRTFELVIALCLIRPKRAGGDEL